MDNKKDTLVDDQLADVTGGAGWPAAPARPSFPTKPDFEGGPAKPTLPPDLVGGPATPTLPDLTKPKPGC